MNTLKIAKHFCIFVILILVGLSSKSCSKKPFLSGNEGYLIGYQKDSEKNYKKRQEILKKEQKQREKLEQRANRSKLEAAKRREKIQEKLAKEHVNRQDPKVKARMKQNQRETKKKYARRKTLKELLLFWK